MEKLDQTKRSEFWVDIIFITILSAIYFIIFLGSRNLSIPDEGRYPEIAREMLDSGNWITPTINGVPFLDKPIMYYWLEAISLKIFGVNAWGARMPMAVFGFIGVILTYLFGRKLYSRRVGVIAAAIVASSPVYFLSAHYANLDLEVATFLWISALLMLVGLQQPFPSKARMYYFYGAYAVGGLAFLTKGLMGFVFPAMAIGIWVILLNNWRVLKEIYLPTGIVIFLVISVPWCVLAQMQNPDFLYYFFYYQQFARFVGDDFHTSKIMGPWFYFLIMIVGMLPWSIYFTCRLKKGADLFWKDRHKDSKSLFLLIWAVAIFIFFSIPHTKLVGYILPIFVPLALLMAKTSNTMIESDHITKGFKVSHAIGSIVLVIVGLGLLIFPAVQHKIPAGSMYPVFIPTALIMIIGAIISHSFVRKNQLIKSIFISTITIALFNLGVVLSAPVFDTKGSEPLTNKVKPLLQKDSIVMSYENYKEDIPFLLQRKVYIVSDWHDPDILKSDNWKREFYFGITQYEQSHNGKWPQWYIDKQEFLKMWKNNASVFVFTSNGFYSMLQKELDPKPYLVATHKDYVVFAKPND
jgi:4-amino-4-deoxy-L-arabinose transferase-like glycosyltransferase